MKIEVDIYVDQKVPVEFHVGDIICAINEMEVAHRWNAVAQLLNGIENNADDLDEGQHDFVVKYLRKKLELFTQPSPAASGGEKE